MEHKKYMKIALSLAKKAIKNGDIPIGAIVVDRDGNILGRGYNRKEKENNPIKHAEVIAISKACKKVGSWRLENCIIYSTLEPCLMCLGAILQTRINWIIFGLASEKFGCVKTLDKLRTSKNFNNSIQYTYEFTLDSKKMLQFFFTELRTQSDMIDIVD
ncbi:MAG: nucleoside deaminase [Spiroplasma sp.]